MAPKLRRTVETDGLTGAALELAERLNMIDSRIGRWNKEISDHESEIAKLRATVDEHEALWLEYAEIHTLALRLG